MNPIPLSAPDGRIYAYACGTCHHVRSSSTPMWIDDPPGPQCVEHRRKEAEACCTCHSCHAPMSRINGPTCAACRWWFGFGQVWYRIGNGETPERCKVCGMAAVYCRDRKPCIDCSEEHASYPDGRCRDCWLAAATAGAE